MKKIFLLSILLFQLTFVFGQDVTYAWGPWVQNPCFKGLQSRCKVKDYNSSAKQYTWDIEIKNNYSRKVSFNFDIQNSSIDGRTSINPGGIDKGWTLNPSSTNLYVEFSKVCFDPNDYCSINSNGTQNKGYKCYAECDNGVPNVPKLCGNTNSQSNSTNQKTTQQNDPIFDRNNSSFQDYYKRATSAGQAGNYDEAISLWNSAIAVAVNDDQRNNAKAWLAEAEKAKNSSNNQKQNQEIANRNAEAQRQQQLLKQQQKTEAINQLTTTTVDLVTYFANRKNALRNSLSNEDGQALLDIVNSENPTEYVKNIIEIFTDLGYTHRETEIKDKYVVITMNNDIRNVNDFMLIFIHPASYDIYNKISFIYDRKQKLKEQLAVLGDNLIYSDNIKIIGISPLKQKIVEQEKTAIEQKNIEKDKIKKRLISSTPIKLDKIIDNNISVQSIIDNCITATGGETKLNTIQNIVEIFEEDSGTYNRKGKRITANGKSAMLATINGKSYKSVFNGLEGFTQYESNKNSYNEKEILYSKSNRPFNYIFSLKKNQYLKLGAIESIENRNYYTIIDAPEMINGVAYINKYYFDIDTKLYFGYETSSPVSKRNRYNFKFDYKKINGILYPTSSISFYIGDETLLVDRTIEIKINEPLTDKDFE